MNQNNIEAIKGQLVILGLSPEIESDLRANICLQQEQFQLSYRQEKDMDVMNCVFYFDRKGDEYCCLYYEACLRKRIIAPDIVVNEINVKELDERMNEIDWKNFLLNKVKNTLRLEAIEGIIVELKKLSTTPDGLTLSDRLKIKFWLDTPLIFLISNPGMLKNQYEISQRFYFFQGEEQISLDEAYRVLSHRWREKQMNVKKKQPENDSEADNGSSVAGAQREIKLLPKKRGTKKKQLNR